MADHSNEEEDSFYYQNTSSTFRSASRKNENAVMQDAEGKAISIWEEARKAVKYFPFYWALEGMLEDIH